MASRSQVEFSNKRNKFVHQVFLSFRGEDVRNGFVGHLFNGLRREGFRVFMDNDGLEHGRDIQMKLQEAIHQSEVSIITLSPRYAESRWCLDELAQIMELNVSPDRFVLPVFFGVEPTDVRHQTGVNREFFAAHEKRFGCESGRVDSWRWALKEVAALRGPSLKDVNGNEAQLILNIIKEVRKLLPTKKLALPAKIIGVDSIVGEICSWIQDESQEVGVGLIHGPGGIGKTTIAEIVFNANCNEFDSSSFLHDIRRVTEQVNGLHRLQRKLIKDISGIEAGELYSLSEGMAKIREVIGPRRILLVLDDVEDLEHLDGLFDHTEWFCPGSKVIITTRNLQLQKVQMFQQKFEVSELNEEESTQLFCLLVFDQDFPRKGYEELSHRFVMYCGGLPLALHVLAPLLRGEDDMEIWEDKLLKLEKYPNQRIQIVLKLSFDSLGDEDDRNMFLHIAIFFVGSLEDYAITILKACGVYTKAGFQNLSNRCLVRVSCRYLMMHPLIQEMGREIVRQESINEPGLRSRLWDYNDTVSVLRKNKGTSSIKGLKLAFPAPKPVTLKEDSHIQPLRNDVGLAGILSPTTPQHVHPNLESIQTYAFIRLDNLNLLELRYVHLRGGYDDFPKTIKWLLWQGCPLESLPQNFELYDLAVLDMQNSHLLKAWEDNKLLGSLRILNLSHSCCLRTTPDFSNAQRVEWIILEGCISLVKIHESIGSLTYLSYLNLSGCKNLRRLPNTIEKLRSIKEVNLSGCPYLFSVPDRLESSIIFASSSNQNLSPSLSQILRSPFYLLKMFPSLVKLSLLDCGITSDDIFDTLISLSSLRELDLSYNPIRRIKKDMRAFTRLRGLTFAGCSNLQIISQVPGSVNLIVCGCLSLERVEYKQNPFLNGGHVNVMTCPNLVEIEGIIRIEPIGKMDDRMARYLGFPNLESSPRSTLLVGGVFDFGLFEGVYQYGIYNVFLEGDRIVEDWFTVTASGSEILYTVPWLSDDPIRAFNVCCVSEFGNYNDCTSCLLQIENLTTKCKWLYFPAISPLHGKRARGTKVTWLSHWSVMQHRDVRAGHELRVSFYPCKDVPIKCGINIVYEVEDEDIDFTTGNQALQHNSLASVYHDTFHSVDLSDFEDHDEQGTYILNAEGPFFL